MPNFFKKSKNAAYQIGAFAGRIHRAIVHIPNTLFYKKSKQITEQGVSALNGAIGDSLATTPLGIEMGFYEYQQKIDLDAAFLERYFDNTRPPSPKICILIHGLTHNETAWEMPQNFSYGIGMERDLAYTPFYLRYNTGLHISDNGQQFSRLLEQLMHVYPVPITQITIIAHSMGGLVTHSACHYAQQGESAWTPKVKHIFLLGSPHLGSFLEKFANVTTNILEAIPNLPTRWVGNVINWRSAGIKDLRFGYLSESDWKHHHPDRLLLNNKKPPRKLENVAYYVISGRLTQDEKHWVNQLFGDILVRNSSAAARSAHPDEFNFPPENHYEFAQTNHFQLTKSQAVFTQIKQWIQS